MKSFNKTKNPKTSQISILVGLSCALLLIDLLFIFLSQGEAKTITLLKSELKTLKQQEQIITSANEIYTRYKDEINVISDVFPSEETIPDFIKTLEYEIRQVSNQYSFKFNSTTPLREQNRAFLPLSITLKADLIHLLAFLDKLEKLPYMTHVSSFISKNPSGFTAEAEVNLFIKVYVQDSFTAK